MKAIGKLKLSLVDKLRKICLLDSESSPFDSDLNFGPISELYAEKSSTTHDSKLSSNGLSASELSSKDLNSSELSSNDLDNSELYNNPINSSTNASSFSNNQLDYQSNKNSTADEPSSFIIDTFNKVENNGFHASSTNDSNDYKLRPEFKLFLDELETNCLYDGLEQLDLNDDENDKVLDVPSKIVDVLNKSRILAYSSQFSSTSSTSSDSSNSSNSLVPDASSDSLLDLDESLTDIKISSLEARPRIQNDHQVIQPASNLIPKIEAFPSLGDARFMYNTNQQQPVRSNPVSSLSWTNCASNSKTVKPAEIELPAKTNLKTNLNDFLARLQKEYAVCDDEINKVEEKKIKIPDDVEKNVCYYCKLSNPYCTIKCGECGIYFCNYKGSLGSSHIVFHLLASGHKQLDFELDKAFGKRRICNLCNCDNIFQLGFVCSNKSQKYIICRVPCQEIFIQKKGVKTETVSKPIFKDYPTYFSTLNETFGHLLINGERTFRADGQGQHYVLPSHTKLEFINICNWKPFINTDKCLNEVLLEGLSKKEAKICAKVDKKAIEEIESQLEELRNDSNNRFNILNKDIIKELDTCDTDNSLPPVLLCYADGTQYKEVFLKHIKHEKNLEDICKEDAIGAEVIFKRTIDALTAFEKNKMRLDKNIYDSILGKPIPPGDECSIEELPDIDVQDLKAPNLPNVNQSQAEAINFALKNPLTLIQGPPGTGKTLTSAVLVYNLHKLSLKGKILVSAPSNVACDHLANKIHKTGLKVVRLLSRTKEEEKDYFSPLSIHHKVENPELGSELADFIELLSTRVFLSKNDQGKLEKLRSKYCRQLIEDADVVCVTCCSSVDSRLKGFKFSTLLIDEVCQATEPEVLIPLSVGIKKLVMIGDPCQLAPVIKSRESVELGFDQPLFKRLVILGHKSFMLNQQYRMHPFLSKYSCEQFYKGKLLNGVTESERTSKKFKFPFANKPLIFLNCVDHEQSSLSNKTGPSFLNQREAQVIGKIVHKLINNGIKPKDIGIITPYKGQQQYLKTNLKFFCNGIKYDQIEIASINAYQGREKNFIILSTVRSNKMIHKGAIGFLSDQRRLNVGLTRCKYGLIIVGDLSTLVNHPTWYNLIKFYRDNNLLFGGEIDSLNPFTGYRLKKPNLKDEMANSIFKSTYYVKVVKVSETDDNEDEVEYKKLEFFV